MANASKNVHMQDGQVLDAKGVLRQHPIRNDSNIMTNRGASPSIELFPQRFRTKVELDAITGCWIWLASSSCQPGFPQHRYGTYSIDGTPESRGYAHRFAFEFAHGRIPPGLEIHHTCNRKLCVNPAHLRAITHRENCRLRNPKRWKRNQFRGDV